MIASASAPGKVILCGEHAVVYGQPAIALPLSDVRAVAQVEGAPPSMGIEVVAPDVSEQWQLTPEQQHPLALLIRLTLARLAVAPLPDLHISLRSAIPIASGMGSGAAIGAALVKALAAYFGAQLPPAEVSQLVYESERGFHGTPSGIDNSVVSYEQAMWFVRGAALTGQTTPPVIEPVTVGVPFSLVIGDTGVRAPTRVTVARVRERWEAEKELYSTWFAEIGRLATQAREALLQGDVALLGTALNRNQKLLQQLGVSSPELERLIVAARSSGALGAKLSGGGGGGIMLALVDDVARPLVARALHDAGATRVIETVVH